MKILGIDTTALVASVGIVSEETTVAEFTINNKKTHSENLMPMIQQMLEMAELQIADMDYIATSSGPGSFTGLRIGIATAKALAHGINKPIIPVPTLDALAYNVLEEGKIVIPMMDARREQVYTGTYVMENNRQKNIVPARAVSLQQVLEEASQYDKPVIFVGDGAIVHRQEICKYPSCFQVGAPHQNIQRGTTVASWALKNIHSAVNYNQIQANYLRLSQAEREYERKNAND